ncbi:hypothetical protein DY000_02020928 [Brassica cretica]|uniref:t-SNARE coiled-coil homology domain-containing protein n=1 Tax=Brassica cretica TaxID=69181 RepID=A0ABQ7EFK5_BRACR|nr:hypothetical protein DY000_02020928 [Brassica cretica]
MKSQPDFHTRAEIDQLVEEIYRTLETTEERLDRRCDDIYFPMDLSISVLTSKIEAIQEKLVEIQSYIARRPEASASFDRRNNKTTDILRQTLVDDATNRGRLVPKVTSDMFDTHNQREEISADTYATLRRHQFNLESLGDRSHHPTSIDDDRKNSHPMKSQPDFHTRAEIDQLVEEIYRTLETTEERLDRRCDDIYFPMDLSISVLTSKIEAIQEKLVEIQSYIARRPEASASFDRRNNKTTDILRQTLVDDATNRGRLVPKVTSDMFDTHNQREEISADTYATLRRHQFNLESLGDRS